MSSENWTAQDETCTSHWRSDVGGIFVEDRSSNLLPLSPLQDVPIADQRKDAVEACLHLQDKHRGASLV
jgi:hypothetical protein